MKKWFYKKIGAERYYKTQVANRARAWGKQHYIGTYQFEIANDFFIWATGVDLRHIPNSSREREE